MKLMWHNYLIVLSLGTRAIKLCTETSLTPSARKKTQYSKIQHSSPSIHCPVFSFD
jgi:hypothetical protein